MSFNSPESSIQYIKGVGPAKAKLLANLGVFTAGDLLCLYPRRYEDRSTFTPIIQLKSGLKQTVTGKILSVGKRNFYSAAKRFEIIVSDDSGSIRCVWFNQPYLDKYFKPGQEIVLYGQVEVFKKHLQMIVPDFELIDVADRSLNMGRIVPIYPLTKGITQRYLRRLIDMCLREHTGQLIELLPKDVLARQHLKPIIETVHDIHFPKSLKAQEEAVGRSAFEEFYLFQISVILRRLSILKKPGIVHTIDIKFEFAKGISFKLTTAQEKVIGEIAADLKQNRPMLRLVQGDVGCGKTIVAFYACLNAFKNGHQSAIMAPTEILAKQHYLNFKKLCGHIYPNLSVGLLTSQAPKKEKERIIKDLKEGKIDLIIGTHALTEDEVIFKDLSLVVIDEQHKFGVNQRGLLTGKGKHPHVLIMTATPIPRTLCLTLYGDLDVSVIDQMPPGRGKVMTYHFPLAKSNGVYEKVKEWVKKGTQAYIIYPMVDESEKLDLKSATESFEHFKAHEFKDLRLGLVHGQMKKEEIEKVMEQFKAHELDILVSTTILEVGIDVANANVMLIEHAERFGLSQLHQMRGRIGRGAKDAICILLADPLTDEAKSRIDAMISTTDGFKIAEYDLQIRGPGQYFGGNQSGLNELRLANPLLQINILEQARKEAILLTQKDPNLVQSQQIKKAIQRKYPQYLEMLLAG